MTGRFRVTAVLSVWWMVGMVASAGSGVDVPVPADSTFAARWSKADVGVDLWAGVLEDHVDADGLVDYAAIGKDRRFLEYLYRLAKTSAEDVGDGKARLAYWINAYNACAIYGMVRSLPADRSKWDDFSPLAVKVPGVEGNGFFVGLRFMVGGVRYTLDEMEKGVMLRRGGAGHDEALIPAGPDPRIHFALVCAAKGCPVLSRRPYRAATVDAQLDEAVRAFVADTRRVVFHRASRRLEVSQLLDWYGGDLTNPEYDPHAKSVPAFLARYVPDEDLARLLRAERWKMTPIEYDWKVNLQR